PDTYNGHQNIREFQRFMTLVGNYIEDAGVKKNRMIIQVSPFLKGEAFKWYQMEIANRENEITLKDFFKLLYNWVFPPDYRQRQRDAWEKLYQGHKSVKEYAAEIRDLQDTIGIDSQREIIQKFWCGLDENIQDRLWMKDLDPDT
ncbi:hypothetical protein FA15DRAFT_550508, partial [Coprinopsis marcescibilis]